MRVRTPGDATGRKAACQQSYAEAGWCNAAAKQLEVRLEQCQHCRVGLQVVHAYGWEEMNLRL